MDSLSGSNFFSPSLNSPIFDLLYEVIEKLRQRKEEGPQSWAQIELTQTRDCLKKAGKVGTVYVNLSNKIYINWIPMVKMVK